MGSRREEECDVGLGLRMQNDNKSTSRKKLMTVRPPPHVLDHHHHQSLINNGGFGDGTRGGAGTIRDGLGGSSSPSLFNNPNNPVASSYISNNLFDYDIVGGGIDSASMVPKNLFYPNSETLSYNYPGVMVNGNLRVPNFTPAQRQELEDQKLIFKYIMSSSPVPAPVPAQLLPISNTPFNRLELGNPSLGIPNNVDSEPWRCRRTDGKKWRCSRNVVPEQKYCERHSHKSRSRSRKPVEQPHSNNNNKNNTSPYQKSESSEQRKKIQPILPAPSHEQTRNLEWLMKGESEAVTIAARTNQEWLQMMQSQEPNDQLSSLVNPKMKNPLGGGGLETRHFIDAWSSSDNNPVVDVDMDRNYSASSRKKLQYSSLSLSMHGGNEEETEKIMGRENDGEYRLQWMNPDSWIREPPGGPLAEALCLGIAGSSRANSSHGCNSGTASSRSSS
ncbi:hypothetical protein UlMin_001691 [Ulmus minor]